MQKMVMGCAIAALLVYSGTASATLVTTGTAPVVYDWSENVTGTGGVQATLSGDLIFSNFNFAGTNSVSFNVLVANDTQQGSMTLDQFNSTRLTSFGFDTDPLAGSVSDTSVVFNSFLDKTLPGFQHVDVCLAPGTNNCAGGGNGGLAPGESTSFLLTLSGFATDITSIDLGIGATEEAAVKFQTGYGSFEFSNPPNGNPPPPPPPPLPEPATLAMMGSGLLAMAGIMGWRRRNGK